jgi:hypothetical protein
VCCKRAECAREWADTGVDPTMYMCARSLNISDAVHPNQGSRLSACLGCIKTPMGKATNRPGLPDDE